MFFYSLGNQLTFSNNFNSETAQKNPTSQINLPHMLTQ